MAAHLHALRALCRGLMEKSRTEPDPLEKPDQPDEPGSSGHSKRRRLDAETRRQNRQLGVQGRAELIEAEERCVMCLEQVRERTLECGMCVCAFVCCFVVSVC